MKRWIALILLASTLLLAACGPAETVSEILSQDESSAETGSEDVQQEYKHTLISVGKPYTTNQPYAAEYPDLFGQQLTDGQKTPDIGAHYIDVRMVCYHNDNIITIDLGEDGKRLTGMSARVLDMTKDGVTIASSVRFYGSEDGTKWKSLGRAPFDPTGDMTVSTATVYFDEPVDYRYVRAFYSKGYGMYFIDEVEVYADVEPEEYVNAGLAVYEDENIARGAWKQLSTGKAAAPAASQNVATEKTYTFEDCVFDERAPQNDKHLTDGARTGRLFGEDAWVGIKAEGTPSVVLDLGKVRKDLYAFGVHALGSGLNVSYPGAIDVYGSSDGKEYILLGRMYAPAECDNYAYSLILPEYVEARYLRFQLVGGTEYAWLEEIEVMAGMDEAPDAELYPEVNIPYVTEELYWDASESDYNVTQNLILGLPQQIASTVYAAPNLETDAQKRSTVDSTLLTDGKLARSMYCYGGEWFYFSTPGGAIDVFYDIGKLSTVNSLQVDLLEQAAWGISGPRHITVFLSENAEEWYKVDAYSYDPDKPLNQNETRMTYDFILEQAYVARFVRFRIEASSGFVDELTVTGTKAIQDGAIRLKDSDIVPAIYYTDPSRTRFMDTDSTSMRADEVIFVDGTIDEGETLDPYVAYLDENGKAVDMFMNGFVYVPTYEHAKVPSFSNWQSSMLTPTFEGSFSIAKLNETVGKYKEELNMPDYKAYVYITIPTVDGELASYGDVDGDGVSESWQTAEGRAKTVRWCMDYYIRKFNEGNYEHLEFDGVYWLEEALDWYVDNSEVVKEITDIVHEYDTNIFWVPYYTANRYHLGYELGFDVVCMQPNYMFTNDAPLYRFDVTVSRTERLNMCVEIEHSYQALSDPDYLRSYMLYLYYGAVSGYMTDSIHIYYDCPIPVDGSEHSLLTYKATYEFAKGTLDIYPDARETLTLKTGKDTALEGELNTENTLSLYTLTGAPEHGILSMNVDGDFVYYPEKGYTGTDTFTYTYNNYLGESETCTVEITVE